MMTETKPQIYISPEQSKALLTTNVLEMFLVWEAVERQKIIDKKTSTNAAIAKRHTPASDLATSLRGVKFLGSHNTFYYDNSPIIGVYFGEEESKPVPFDPYAQISAKQEDALIKSKEAPDSYGIVPDDLKWSMIKTRWEEFFRQFGRAKIAQELRVVIEPLLEAHAPHQPSTSHAKKSR